MFTNRNENSFIDIMKKIISITLLFFLLIVVIIIIVSLKKASLNSKKESESPKEIMRVKSKIDFNNNGIDDYSDFVIGARKQTESNPRYDGSKVYPGGYPPDGEGVCTDLIWKAFKQAGYSLKDMIDYDINKNNELYYATHLYGPNPDIDFRRVRNMQVFFERFAKRLTLDPYDIVAWQPGDIVIFGDQSHIAIISDKRNEQGIPFIMHTSNKITGEEDGLLRRHYDEKGPITRHYRFEYDDTKLKTFKWVD